MLKRIPALPPRSRVGRGTIRHHCLALAGLVLATNVAMAQNWVPGGPSGNPVIPFDARDRCHDRGALVTVWT